MILRTARSGDREVRAAEFGTSTIPAPWADGVMTRPGLLLTDEIAHGLPTVAAAIRLLSTTIASLPLYVYEGREGEKRKRYDTQAYQLLQVAPNDECTPFDLICDTAASVEASGNAFIQKIRATAGKLAGKVVALYLLDPQQVEVRRDERSLEKVFRVAVPGRGWVTLTSADILHVRGHTWRGGIAGVSPIALHRDPLGIAAALDQYQGDFFRNGTTLSGVLEVPGNLNETQALEIQHVFDATHQGLGNAWKPAILKSGATWKQMGVSLEDAQFVESQRLSMEKIALIFLGPAAPILYAQEQPKTEEATLRFFNFALLHRLRRIEHAFRADQDLFPPGEGLYSEFDMGGFLRADAATQALVEHHQTQSGIRLVDEVRADHGWPPLPPIPEDPSKEPGKVPQITPVGGAPNVAGQERSREALQRLLDESRKRLEEARDAEKRFERTRGLSDQ